MSRRTILFVHSSDPSDHVGGGEKSLVALAERLGAAALERVSTLTWERTFEQLLLV